MSQVSPAYSLRPATEADWDFVWELKVASLKPYIEQTWGWDEEVQVEWTRKQFEETAFEILSVGMEDVGMLDVRRDDQQIALAGIYLMPEWQRRGLGTAILHDLLAEGAAAGLPVSLQVLKVNPARALYERLGFRVVSESETHYLMRQEP